MGLGISCEGLGGDSRPEVSKIPHYPNSPFSGKIANVLQKKLDNRSSVLYKNLKALQKRR
jgi:hypothetical protein